MASATLHWCTSVNWLLFSVFFQIKRVITSEAMTPQLFMDIMDRQKVSSIFAATFLCHQFVLSGRRFLSLKSTVVCGAAITKELIARMKQTFPNAVIKTGYGCTEGDFLTFLDGSCESNSSGIVFQNTQIKVR